MLAPGIVEATSEHAVELAETMGEADRQEIAALGQTPAQALELCLLQSRDTKHSWIVDRRVICMWGVGFYTPMSMEATPWMLGSRDLPKHTRTFARGSKIIAEMWKERYPILRNFVDARHTLAVRWIDWMGFTLLPAMPYGPFGTPFHPFQYVRQ